MVAHEEDCCEVEHEKHKYQSTVTLVDYYPELRKSIKISANHLSLREMNEVPKCFSRWMEKITRAISREIFLEIYCC